ncbi:hypothetical protein Goari_001803, partial [Gossypium aridum]|nr:hypothetical protein [Gossypium aridum]
MLTYEQEHDFVYWGLQLFNSDPYANCGYDGVVTQEDEEHYPVNYFEDHYGAGECCNVENDEAIAHTVQFQELSQRAIIESSNKVSGYPQDCVDQSIGDFSSGQNCGQEVQDDTGPLSSCSSPEEKLVSEVDRLYSLELADEYALDREVGKRLNQMVPVPHVPRINGEIPSVDEATLDHLRLLERFYGSIVSAYMVLLFSFSSLVDLFFEYIGNSFAIIDYRSIIWWSLKLKEMVFVRLVLIVESTKLKWLMRLHYGNLMCRQNNA